MPISAPPVLLSLLRRVPALWPDAGRFRGTAQAHTACTGPWCGEVLAVDGRPLDCRIDHIGLPGQCRLRGGADADTRLGTGLEVEATVMRVTLLLLLLGKPATEGRRPGCSTQRIWASNKASTSLRCGTLPLPPMLATRPEPVMPARPGSWSQ